MEILETGGSARKQSDAELCVLLPKHPNVLFEGAGTLTDALFSTLKPYLLEPILWRRPGEPLGLKTDQHGSLVLQDVAMLDRQQQRTLSLWLQDTSHHRQIVSTTTTPLFPLVEQGQFDPTLYYRLNVVLLQL